MVDSSRGLTRLQNELEKAKESLKDVDKNIKKITGRDPTVQRPVRHVSLGKRNSRGTKAIGNESRIFNLAWRGIVPDDSTFGRVGRAFSKLRSRQGKGRGVEEQYSGDDEDLPHKPTVQSLIVATPKKEQSRKNSIDELSRDRKGQARNRRMFGLLLGTLQKFKHEFEETKEKGEQRSNIEKKLEKKFKQEKEWILRERKQLFQERKQKQYRIRLIEQKMEMAQNHEEWEHETRKLKNFICTKSKPHLFYMPKILTLDSDTTLKETKTKVDEMIETHQKKLEEEISDLMSRVHRSTGDKDDDNEASMGEDGEESEGERAEQRQQQDQSPGKHDTENRDKHDTSREQRDRDREQVDRDRQMIDKRQVERADQMERERHNSGKEEGVARTKEHNKGGERGKAHVRHRDRSRSHSSDHNKEQHKSGKSISGSRKHSGEKNSQSSPSKHRLIGDGKAEKRKKKSWAPMENEEKEFVSSKSGTGEKEGVSIQSKMLEIAGISKIVKRQMIGCEQMEINFQSENENVADIPTPAGVYTDPGFFKEGGSRDTDRGGGDQIQVNDSETVDT